MIFGIGMNKTGTSSLHTALGMLGIRSLHDHALVKQCVTANTSADLPLLWGLDLEYQAFTDSPICYLYRQLDIMYPESKFILTVRNIEDWVVSRMAKYAGASAFHRAVYESHVSGAQAYFADRPQDLLTYDLCGGAGWKPLCEFLNLPEPTEPFPFKNATPANYLMSARVRLQKEPKHDGTSTSNPPSSS